MLSVVVVVTRSSLQKSLTLADLLFNALTAYFNELYTAQRTRRENGSHDLEEVQLQKWTGTSHLYRRTDETAYEVTFFSFVRLVRCLVDLVHPSIPITKTTNRVKHRRTQSIYINRTAAADGEKPREEEVGKVLNGTEGENPPTARRTSRLDINLSSSSSWSPSSSIVATHRYSQREPRECRRPRQSGCRFFRKVKLFR